jgi:hypothetical protein
VMDGLVLNKTKLNRQTQKGKQELLHRRKQKLEKSYILYRMKQSEMQSKETKNEKIQEVC